MAEPGKEGRALVGSQVRLNRARGKNAGGQLDTAGPGRESRSLVGRQIRPARAERAGHWWAVRYGRTGQREREDRALVGSQIRPNRVERARH